mmetsp:Transcript_10397/g.16435  ORF Transcript_10397/g.16435 Transcript_10397/m.16435 type:complete len:266 (-) Transcript_10397:84-881(-)
MEYMIRKTRFKVSDLYWLKEYAEKYFPSGEASPDDWGKFITFIVKELKAHRGEAKTKDDERERPLDDFDALLMYRESPTIEGNSGKISLEELLSGLSVLVVDKVPIKTKKTRKSKGTTEKKEKVKKKPDPWGKFDFAWNLLDKDGDDSLSHEEFILFCQRMIRFGFLRADYLTSQTVSLPNFPPEFVSMDGKMLAKLYWDALNLPEDGVITRTNFEEESKSLQCIGRLYYWHLEDVESGFFGGTMEKYKEIYRRYQRQQRNTSNA